MNAFPGDIETPTRTLDTLADGEAGTIVRLEGEPVAVRRLMELGLVPGTPIQRVRRAPLGDPIEFSVRDVRLSLRRSEASGIHVVTA
jgi:Fe2+ transport system protein FeoA